MCGYQKRLDQAVKRDMLILPEFSALAGMKGYIFTCKMYKIIFYV